MIATASAICGACNYPTGECWRGGSIGSTSLVLVYSASDTTSTLPPIEFDGPRQRSKGPPHWPRVPIELARGPLPRLAPRRPLRGPRWREWCRFPGLRDH